MGFLNYLIPPAYAAGVVGGADAKYQPLLLLVVFAAAIYFLMWRPQSRRAKQHREMLSTLNSGDEVVTSGGIVGRIERLQDSFVSLKIAEDSVIMVQRPSIAGVLPKGTMKL